MSDELKPLTNWTEFTDIEISRKIFLATSSQLARYNVILEGSESIKYDIEKLIGLGYQIPLYKVIGNVF